MKRAVLIFVFLSSIFGSFLWSQDFNNVKLGTEKWNARFYGNTITWLKGYNDSACGWNFTGYDFSDYTKVWIELESYDGDITITLCDNDYTTTYNYFSFVKPNVLEAYLSGEKADRAPADEKLIDKSKGFKLLLQSYLEQPRPEDQKVIVKSIRFFKEGEADSEIQKTQVLNETVSNIKKTESQESSVSALGYSSHKIQFTSNNSKAFYLILLLIVVILISIIFIFIFKLLYIYKYHEKEKRHLAMELHDSVAQQMYYVSMLAEKIDDEELAKEIKANQSECIENIRNICFTLSSEEMNKISFVEELKSTIERFEKRTKINSKLVITPEADFDFLKKSDFQNLLQVISELLTNIEKHSGASEATVLIRHPSGNDKITNGLVIYISDNGNGIEEKLLKEMNSKKVTGIKNRHYGIQNIKLRLKKISGSIKYISAPGEGTEVEITIGK
ncbi:MAG: hypothetical protein K5829_09030 [Treponema sp.]|nr:hypothetical protein [Treponema sp.]